jgi:hypothetical protein
LLLSLGDVPITAMLRAELLACKSMTDQAETAIAYLATRFNRCSNLPSHLAHGRGSLGDEGMREDYSQSGGWYCADQRQCYSLSLALQAAIRQLNNSRAGDLSFLLAKIKLRALNLIEARTESRNPAIDNMWFWNVEKAT